MKSLAQLIQEHPELEAIMFAGYQAGMADGIALEKSRQIQEATNQASGFFASLDQQPTITATPLFTPSP